MDGIINVYKEKGFTSFDVVAKLRRILGQKKIGHTGTLDPDATGVLPVCLGKATKLVEFITEKDKRYRAVVKLGVVTDTLDITGNVLETNEFKGSSQDIVDILPRFVGKINQVPPMYSAIKVDGKKLYELARAGKVIERKERTVNIYSIDLVDLNLSENEFTIDVHVSKGTYIRSLCDDIGKALGCGACMAQLERTASGTFDKTTAMKLSEIENIVTEKGLEGLMENVVPLMDVFVMKKVIVAPEFDFRLKNGNELTEEMYEEFYAESVIEPFVSTGDDDIMVYYSDGRFAAVYTQIDGTLKIHKMFYN